MVGHKTNTSNTSLKVLLIDVDPVEAKRVRDAAAGFENLNAQVDWCSDYDEGVAELMLQKHDLYLVSYELGRRNGADLIREGLTRDPLVPVIVLTPDAEDEWDSTVAMRYGAYDFQKKSDITSETLEWCISMAAERCRQLKSLRAESRRDGYDTSTGLFHKKTFLNRVSTEVEQVRQRKDTFAVLVFDVEKLRSRDGLETGDKAMKSVAKKVTDTIRATDFAGRYGSNEFAVALPGTSADNAILAAERIRKCLGAESEPGKNVNVGVLELDEPITDLDEFAALAERALKEAKESGRTRTITRHDLHRADATP